MRDLRAIVYAFLLLVAGAGVGLAAAPESLHDALGSAYIDNANLNSARAQMRSIDENVAQAKSGRRPQVNISGDASAQWSRNTFSGGQFGSPSYPRGGSISVDLPIYVGGRTQNAIKQAKNAVFAARAQLRGVEQDILLEAVRAFMGVVRAQVVLNLRAQNVEFLREQVRAATDRKNVGESTRTDVEQTEARLAAGMSEYAAAAAAATSAIAVYEQIIGHEPRLLGAVNSIEALLPPSLAVALEWAARQHPDIVAAILTIDIAAYNVKVLEGALLPTVTLQGSLSHRDDSGGFAPWSDTATISGRVNVPIYDGGEDSSKVRQAKETLGQRRLELDAARAQVRQIVISAWGTFDAAKAQVRAALAQVSAQLLVLGSVEEERKVGQRTTLDVLNASQELLGAKVAQVQAQHDRVVAAYSLLAAVGKLSAEMLGLRVRIYDPEDHYDKVKDKWFGLRTPDGR